MKKFSLLIVAVLATMSSFAQAKKLAANSKQPTDFSAQMAPIEGIVANPNIAYMAHVEGVIANPYLSQMAPVEGTVLISTAQQSVHTGPPSADPLVPQVDARQKKQK